MEQTDIDGILILGNASRESDKLLFIAFGITKIIIKKDLSKLLSIVSAIVAFVKVKLNFSGYSMGAY